jgi:hypothetical protein
MEAFVIQNLICKIFIHKLPNLHINRVSIHIWGWRVCFTLTLLACVIRSFEMAFEVLWLHSCIYLLFTIYNLTFVWDQRESIRRKVDHGGQIVLWYWQHATNLARVSMSLARMLMWVKGRAKQKNFPTFCVFGQTRNKCSSSSTFPKLQPWLYTYMWNAYIFKIHYIYLDGTSKTIYMCNVGLNLEFCHQFD